MRIAWYIYIICENSKFNIKISLVPLNVFRSRFGTEKEESVHKNISIVYFVWNS